MASLKGDETFEGHKPRGLSGHFQKTWSFTRADMFGFIKEVLEEACVPAEALKALLVLIPKKENPLNIKCFGPISLCNIVVIKLATKMVVNRLKGVWQSLIAPNQESFVPWGQSVDDVIICQEPIIQSRIQ